MIEQLTATPVIKDKFWVVESQGRQVGSIQAKDDGGFAYVHNQTREYFPTIRAIKRQYNIRVLTAHNKKKTASKHKEIYGYPCHKTPYSEVFDVRRQLPIYSLNDKSKSYYCAGYYLVDYGNQWLIEFCPKLISINRHRFIGPFVTKDEAQKELEKSKEQTS
jgi:hypothetical protein